MASIANVAVKTLPWLTAVLTSTDASYGYSGCIVDVSVKKMTGPAVENDGIFQLSTLGLTE